MKLFNLTVKTGTYQGRDGQQKNSYENVGDVHDGKYGQYAMVNPLVMMGLCMSAIMRGESRLLVSFYPADKESQQQRPRQAPSGASDQQPYQPPFDDLVPF